jgi:hypothetical protein
VPERGGVRLPRQAEAGGTSHRHPVSGSRGCRALPPHFPLCSLGVFRRIGAAMASGYRPDDMSCANTANPARQASGIIN